MLHKLQLAPLSGIVATVKFKNGIASEIYVYLEIDDRDAAGTMQPGTGATIHLSAQSQSCAQHFCTYLTQRWGYPWAVVEMDSDASKEAQAKALAIKTGCLIKIGGCKKPEVILPQVFGSM
ncbi:MAG: hypothetical protein WB729_09765 [Candidatus Sulfotelmatobacter sp.]